MVMARESVSQQKKVISEIFSIPEGVEDLTYVVDETFREQVVEDTSDYSDEELSEIPDVGQSLLDTPDILGVIEPQELRTSLGGGEVVDVIIEVSDVPGADNYEFRVTKV